MMRGLWFFVTLIVCIVIIACDKNSTENIDLESDAQYYPLKIGQFKEYQTDSILYRQGKFLDSVRSYLREEITGSFRDTLGQVFIILQSYRKKETDNWKPAASYTARIYDYKAVRNEGNIHFISLVFPTRVNLGWNGLALINTEQIFDVEGESVQVYQGWEPFVIKEPAGAEKIGTLNFSEIISVLQTDEEDILSKRYSLEKYAKGVGLVYKEMTVYDCNSNINACNNTIPWTRRATKGFSLRQIITKYN